MSGELELGLGIRYIRDCESKDARLIRVHIAQAAIEALKRFGIQPDSNAWRCWWETQ